MVRLKILFAYQSYRRNRKKKNYFFGYSLLHCYTNLCICKNDLLTITSGNDKVSFFEKSLWVTIPSLIFMKFHKSDKLLHFRNDNHLKINIKVPFQWTLLFLAFVNSRFLLSGPSENLQYMVDNLHIADPKKL